MKVKTEKIDNIAIVTLNGEVLDANTVSEFKNEISLILKTEQYVIFDMNQVQFVDSSGVGAILSSLRTLNSEGGDLKICSLTKPVQALFELVRMHKIFDIFNTREEAIIAF